jgi:uncharacterized protein YdhG (YjbR/CyaY superfamily)
MAAKKTKRTTKAKKTAARKAAKPKAAKKTTRGYAIKDPDVKAYMDRAEPAQRAALNKLRGQIIQASPEAVEIRAYGIAGFKYKGKPLMYYGYAKEHVGIYGAVPPEFLEDLKAFDVEKGTIRFQPTKPVPATLVKRMVKARMAAIDGKKS